jgi:hypothetical protein
MTDAHASRVMDGRRDRSCDAGDDSTAIDHGGNAADAQASNTGLRS